MGRDQGSVGGRATAARRAISKYPSRRLALGLIAVTAVLASGIGLAGAVAAPIAQTFVVNDTADLVDAAPRRRTAVGPRPNTCTLRAAIQESNANGGADPSTSPRASSRSRFRRSTRTRRTSATSRSSTPSRSSGRARASRSSTAASRSRESPPEQHGLDRIFEIHPGAGDVTLRNLTLQNGFSDTRGGAIQNWSPGKLLPRGRHRRAQLRDRGRRRTQQRGHPRLRVAGGRPAGADRPDGRPRRHRRLDVHAQRLRRDRRRDQQRLDRDDLDPRRFRDHAQPGPDHERPAGRSASRSPRRRARRRRRRLPDRAERDHEHGRVRRDRDDEDRRLVRHDEHGRGERRRHPEQRRRHHRRRGLGPREEPDRGERRRPVLRGRHRARSRTPRQRQPRGERRRPLQRRRDDALRPPRPLRRHRFRTNGESTTVISNNTAEAHGGGMSSDGDGQVFIEGVTFTENFATDSGGALSKRRAREHDGRAHDASRTTARSCTAAP